MDRLVFTFWIIEEDIFYRCSELKIYSTIDKEFEGSRIVFFFFTDLEASPLSYHPLKSNVMDRYIFVLLIIEEDDFIDISNAVLRSHIKLFKAVALSQALLFVREMCQK